MGTPLDLLFPLSSLRDRDPLSRSLDLDLLDRIVGDWLRRDLLGPSGASIPLINPDVLREDERREFLYRSALIRLEQRLRTVSALQVDRIQAFIGASDSETHESFLIFLLLSEWFHRLRVDIDSWFVDREV